MKFRVSVLVVLLAVAAPSFGADVTSWQGKMLPKIKMSSISGRSITNRTLRGKVIVIDFWATWCPPCRKASPIMQKMHVKYGKRGLVVIGADVLEQVPANKLASTAKGYAKGHKYTYLFTFNNDALAKQLGITGIPTMLIVDKRGRIAKVVVGYGAGLQGMLESTISKLL